MVRLRAASSFFACVLGATSLSAGISSLLVARTAQAAEPSEVPAEVTAEDKESARVLFGLGLGLLERGETRLALEKFELADKLYSTPITAVQLGKTHLELGELVEAYDAFQKVATIPVRPSESEKSAAARDEAVTLAAEVRPRLAELRITIVGVAEGTPLAMTIDERPIDAPWAPGPHLLDPGEHRLLVRVSGAELSSGAASVREVSLLVKLKEGEKRTASMAIPPVDEPPPPPEPALEDEPLPHVLLVPRVGFLLSGIARDTLSCDGVGCARSDVSVDLTDQSGVSFALDALAPITRNLRLGLMMLYVPRTRLQGAATGSDATVAPVVEGVLPLSRSLSVFGRAHVGATLLFADSINSAPASVTSSSTSDCCISDGKHGAFVFGFGGGLVVAAARHFDLRAEFLYQRTTPMSVFSSTELVAGNPANSTGKLVSDRLWLLLGVEWGL